MYSSTGSIIFVYPRLKNVYAPFIMTTFVGISQHGGNFSALDRGKLFGGWCLGVVVVVLWWHVCKGEGAWYEYAIEAYTRYDQLESTAAFLNIVLVSVCKAQDWYNKKIAQSENLAIVLRTISYQLQIFLPTGLE